jgi:nucleoid-associated protein YgaU
VAGGASTKIYKVKTYDTLKGIAEKQLGDANRWPEMQRLNRDVVPNPNTLPVGLDLVVVRD